MSDIKNTNESRKRPLSPHLGHYKLPITALTSITHRLTGIFLTLGGAFLVYWLLVISNGKDSFAYYEAIRSNIFVQFLIFGWASALVYHLLTGIRHIFWDFGFGFELSTAKKGSVIIVLIALVAAAIYAAAIFGI